MTKQINSAQLEELLATGKPVIVDFFATWCQPCKAMAPAVDALAEALAGRAEVVKVDLEEGQDAAMKHKVRSVPTFIVFKDGVAAAQLTGMVPLQQFLNWGEAEVA